MTGNMRRPMGEPLTISIATIDGRETVRAVAVNGVWAIHRVLGATAEEDGWCVSHVPSGVRAIHCGDLATARAVLAVLPQCKELAAGRYRYQSALVRRNLDEVARAIKALGLVPAGHDQRCR